MPKDEITLSKLRFKKIFFFDCDGTIYIGNKLFKSVVELIELLKNKKKHFFFLSNNSSLSTKDYLTKLNKFNLNINRENIILSQHPTIAFLKENHYKKIFLMGTQSLKDEFKQEGFELNEENPEIIVLGFDQELTYERLAKVSYFLQNKVPYIATHLDNRCPTEEGYIPDAGGIAALLFKTTERMPKAFGKPNKDMLLYKLKELNISSNDAIIFGDRLYTDIKMGIEANVTTCCVLSGESNLETIKKSENEPDIIIDGIWEFYEAIK